MKRYRGNMLLVELVITLMFFSLSMMVIMQVFATSQQKANESAIVSASLARAQDVAERLSHETNPDAMLIGLGFAGRDGEYLYSDPAGYDLYVALGIEQRPAGKLLTAQLTASRDGLELFTLPSAYYIAQEASAP